MWLLTLSSNVVCVLEVAVCAIQLKRTAMTMHNPSLASILLLSLLALLCGPHKAVEAHGHHHHGEDSRQLQETPRCATRDATESDLKSQRLVLQMQEIKKQKLERPE